ncbi:hypothetical protein EYE40_03985 [Glaciihabitans arcticus]|uniref:Uncharacterized protein n=1 Tax=Glaciihabitans arcticus TaxID=2668039 RepID=A0A4Q9GVF2_9MICO|nr:hypothetical protein [Glaciihabitans arcticus]TBN56623.1 hypothetical protein EYE40_03985 [Glaciihabitans arcticus]
MPTYDDLRDRILTTDSDVLDRVTELLEHGIRRQLWLMFLDADGRQLPLLMPSNVPPTPGAKDVQKLGGFIRELMDQVEAVTIVVTLERSGSEEITNADRAWFRLVIDACAVAKAPLRGPLLCHRRGVRWVGEADMR